MFSELGKNNKSVNEMNNVFNHLKKGIVLNALDKNYSFKDLPRGDQFGGVILRKPLNFKVELSSNPDMERTKKAFQEKAEKEFEKEFGSSYDGDKLNPDKFKRDFIVRRIDEYMYELSEKAKLQHAKLVEQFKKEGIKYRFFINEEGKSDQVFATDIGKLTTVNGNAVFILANFKNNNRKGEEVAANIMFEGMLKIPVAKLKNKNGQDIVFEGGDARMVPDYNVWFLGGGFRTGANSGDIKTSLCQAAEAFADKASATVIPLVLRDKEFYHLDCCFLPLTRDSNGNPWAIIYEGEKDNPTFDKESLALIKKLYGEEYLIKITRDEAKKFATNCVVLKNAKNENCIFVHRDAYSEKTKQKLKILGYKIVELDYDAMHKSGGSIRCSCQEIPESLTNLVIKANDDFKIEEMQDIFKRNQRILNWDKKNGEFVMRKIKIEQQLENMTVPFKH